MHEIVRPVHVCVGQNLWCDVGLAEEVDLHFCGLEQPAPQVHWEGLVDSSDDSNEMVFACLDCTFGDVASVFSGRDQFVFGAILFYGCLIFC